MTKLRIVVFIGLIARFVSATEAPPPLAAQKAAATILQKFPYQPPQIGAKKDSDAASEPSSAVLLPKFIVRAAKPLPPPEGDFLSIAELSALVRKKYPGASLKGQNPLRYDDGLPNYGALLFGEDKRTTQLKEWTILSDTMHRNGDIAGSKELRKHVQETFIRNPDALKEAMDKSANRGRR